MEDHINTIERDLPLVGEVVTQSRQLFFIDGHDGVYGSLSDMERRWMRQEIIAYKETQEDEIVYDSFEIEGKGHLAI